MKYDCPYCGIDIVRHPLWGRRIDYQDEVKCPACDGELVVRKYLVEVVCAIVSIAVLLLVGSVAGQWGALERTLTIALVMLGVGIVMFPLMRKRLVNAQRYKRKLEQPAR